MLARKISLRVKKLSLNEIKNSLFFCDLGYSYQIRLGKYIIVKARQEAGGE